MRRSLYLLSFLFMAVTASAQQELYFEDFEGVSPSFTLNTVDQGSSTSGANTWLINPVYAGGDGLVDCLGLELPFTIPATAGQPGGISAANGNYLHTASTAAVSSGILCCSFGAADGFCTDPGDHFARMSGDVSTIGQSAISLSFWWLCQGGTGNYGEVYYSTNSGSSWTLITTPIAQYRNQSGWTQQTVELPAFEAQATLRFGFRFVNGTTLFGAADPGFGIDDVRITASQAIDNSILTGNLLEPSCCQGLSVNVPYASEGTWGPGNVFTVQLSDASGSFTSATDIGSVNSTTSGTISSVIPVGTPPGTGYRIRVIGSDPATIGSVGSDIFTVVEAPFAGVDGQVTLCKNSGSYDLVEWLGGTPSACGAWTVPTGQVFSGTLNTATDMGGQYTFTTDCPGGCPQDAATVAVTLLNPANAGNDATTDLCADAVPSSLIGFVTGGDLTGIFFYQGQPTSGAELNAPGTYDMEYVVYGTAPCPNDTALFDFTVNAPADAGQSTTFTICTNAAPVELLTLLAGADESGSWTGPSGSSFSGTLIPATDASGLYTYTVPGVAPCPDALAFVALVIDPCAGITEQQAQGPRLTWSGQQEGSHFLTLGGEARVTNVEAYDVAGRRSVLTTSMAQGGRFQVDLKGSAEGIYSIAVYSTEGISFCRLVHQAD